MNPTGKGKALTLELVFNKTKSDNLNNIKNLNLWGNDLEDLQLIEKMPNLEVISLSVNKISSLKDFAKCNKLHVPCFLPRNCTLGRTASPIFEKSGIYWSYLISNPSGCTITPAPKSKITEKLSSITCPTSPNSTTT
jgi:hypothetical protein